MMGTLNGFIAAVEAAAGPHPGPLPEGAGALATVDGGGGGDVPFHPLANLFPLIEGEAFAELVADIAANGLAEPIVLHQAQILDGRNRYRACRLAGVAPRFVIFGLAQASAGIIAAALAGRALSEDEMRRAPVDLGALEPDFTVAGVPGADALAFVVSRNLHRRHLSETQRSMIAARIANLTHGGRRGGDDSDQGANLRLAVTREHAAGLLNVSPRSVDSAASILDRGAPELVAAVERGAVAVSAAASLAHLPLAEQKRLVETADRRAIGAAAKLLRDERTAEKKVRRAERERTLAARQRALPAKRYGVIYADPEWDFSVWSEAGKDRAAENHYPVSAENDIVLRPVATIAAADSVLWLWATVPMLLAALRVMAHWGYTYKSQWVWEKDRPGTGYWNRNRHEILLLGTRGAIPAPAPGTQWDSVVSAPIGEHSEKPAIFYELIEEYFPNLPKIELNARAARPGWDRWGYEAPAQEGGEADGTDADGGFARSAGEGGTAGGAEAGS